MTGKSGVGMAIGKIMVVRNGVHRTAGGNATSRGRRPNLFGGGKRVNFLNRNSPIGFHGVHVGRLGWHFFVCDWVTTWTRVDLYYCFFVVGIYKGSLGVGRGGVY